MSSRFAEMERVINALRSGSDVQASFLLARLRLGERVDDVAKTLPATAASMLVSKPPRYAKADFLSSCVSQLMTRLLSLQGQDSPGTSISGVSQDSVHTMSEGHPTRRQNSSASYASSSEHHPSWATSTSTTASLRSGRGNQPAPGGDVIEDQKFLSLLFDRQDLLLAVSGSDDDDDYDDPDTDNTLDPRLLLEGASKSPIDTSASGLPSPEKGENERSIYVTHLRSRQPIVNTVRIHPNLNLRNLFGNLPFSSSVRANNYPADVQDTQVNNLFLPTWAMMTVSTRPDPGSVKFAFPTIMQEAAALLESGSPVELVIEVHPNIAALFDESEFNTSGMLSRWAAGMVHSLMHKGMYIDAYLRHF